MLLDMVKRREKMKKENLALTTDIFEKRFKTEDWDGALLQQVTAVPERRPLGPSLPVSWANSPSPSPALIPGPLVKREKRAYRKRKHKVGRPALPSGLLGASSLLGAGSLLAPGGLLLPAHAQEILSSDDDRASAQTTQSEQEEEEQEGPFTFRRRAGVEYHPVQEEEEEQGRPFHLMVLPGGVGGRRQDFCLGYGRRRLGRGGRLVLDRIPSRWEEGAGGLEPWAVRPLTPPALQDVVWDPYRGQGVMAGI